MCHNDCARILVFVLVSAAPTPAHAVSFPDVGAGDWFVEAVDVLSDQGIVKGSADGTFRPYAPVTRAEFAVLLSRCLGLAPGTSHPFADLASGVWFEPEVAALYEAGLTSGLTATQFYPYGKVSRQQAASFVVRALGYRLTSQPVEGLEVALPPEQVESWLGGFRDRDLIADVHRPAVAGAYRLQIVSGQTDGRFYPAVQVTRAQCAGMLYAALFKTPQPLAEPPAEVPADLGYPDARTGSQGPHVAWLEQRLTDLTYRPGPVDGIFDERTRQAVVAFQKWEGLDRTGRIGAGAWSALVAASPPTARMSGSGVWIEVDTARQVFLYVLDGVVARTLPTSTGANFSYRSVAYTVERRNIPDGPRYRALYLSPGDVLAIHGYPSVPPYPASGGCIRLTKWDMDDLRADDQTNPMIPDGTSVYIY